MSVGELACTYAALALYSDGIAVTAEKISTLVRAANVNVESYWPTLFAKLLENKNVADLITNVGFGVAAVPVAAASVSAAAAPAPAVEAQKEEVDEDIDDDFCLDLFG